MNDPKQELIERIRANVPGRLRELSVWLLHDSKKTPIYATGKNRSGTLDTPADRGKLVPFERAAIALPRVARASGLGVALGELPGDEFCLCGIDLDDCCHDGQLNDHAREILLAAASYAERSPSGTGLHILGSGDIGTMKVAGAEIYSRGRYLTVTGQRINGAHIADISDAATLTHKLFRPTRIASAGSVAESRSQDSVVTPGDRNNHLSREAYRLRRQGASVDQTLTALRGLNQALCRPLLGDEEVIRIARGKKRIAPVGGTADLTLKIGLSEDELALRFSERHHHELRYVAVWDRWLIWDDARWKHDERKRVFDLSRDLCRDVLAEHLRDPALTESQRKGLRGRLGSAQTIYAVVKLAGSDPRHAVTVDQLDADPWALNTPGGILDLHTGELRPHDPAALHTKITAAIPGGECPLFQSLLERAQPDPAVRDYIQRVAGYGMTGSCREHVLAFWWGGGRNGKGTLAHAIRRALGEYGLEIPAETLVESPHDRHLTEIAVLRGARFVVGSEIDSGRRWNESRLKRLTGGDPISARYIAKDLFEFEPTHTLLIVGNSKPGLRSVDEAIRARMHLVEFGVTIPESERDTMLSERLVAEYGGILAWMLKGCIQWQKQGLAQPEAVRAATAAYLAGEDMLQTWVDECCQRGGELTLTFAHRSYREWCNRNGAVVLGRNTFGDHLEARGFKRTKDSRSGKPMFIGLSLPDPDPKYLE